MRLYSTIIFVVAITFEIMVKRNIKIKDRINILCDVNNPYCDEKMGICGNLRDEIIVYAIPLTILLFLIKFILGVEYA